MTLRTALAESRNIPALKAFQQNKNSDIKNFAESLGLHPQVENGMVYESHALGGYDGEAPLTMAGAYAAFANGGYYTKPYTYTKIVYREDDKTEEVDDDAWEKEIIQQLNKKRTTRTTSKKQTQNRWMQH